MNPTNPFKLTYATMFNPPEELHKRFEVALEQINANLGQEYGMWIDGKDHFSPEKFEDRSPADSGKVLGLFQKGGAEDAALALGCRTACLPSLEPYSLAGAGEAAARSCPADGRAHL